MLSKTRITLEFIENIIVNKIDVLSINGAINTNADEARTKLIRQIDFYNNMSLKDDHLRKGKLHLKSIDIQITEKCSLRCKDCSNLMQYYTKAKDSDMDVLFKSIDRFILSIDSLDEFRVLGGDPFMNKELHKVIANMTI